MKPNADVPMPDGQTMTEDLWMNVPVALFRTRPARAEGGVFVRVNPALARLLGVEQAEDLLQAPVRDFYADPGQRDAILEELTRGVSLVRRRTRFRRADGREILAELTAAPVMDEQGELQFIDGMIQDLSGQELMQGMLRDREQQMHTLLESTGRNALLVLDVNGLVQSAMLTHELEKQWEVSSEEVLGRHFTHIGRVGGCEPFQELFDRVLREVVSGQFVLGPGDDGLECYYDTAMAPLTIEEGRVRTVLCLIRDTSDEHNIVASLERDRTQFRSLLEQTSDGFFILEGPRIVYVNKSFCDISGFDEAELLAMDAYDLPVEEGRERVREIGRARREGQAFPSVYETRIRSREGRLIDVEVSASPIRLGEQTLALGCLRDITERKAAERALRESEARYRGVVESQDAFIVRVTPEGVLTFVNDACCRKLGLSREALIDGGFLHLVHPADRDQAERVMHSVFEAPHKATVEQRVKTPRGWRWFAWEVSGILDDRTGQLAEIQSIGHDVTDRKEYEETIQRRDRILGVLSRSAEYCLRVNAWGDAADMMLADLGLVTEVTRVFLFEMDPDQVPEEDAHFRLQHYWAPNHSPEQINRAWASINHPNVFDDGRWLEHLKKGDTIQGNAADFTPRDNTLLMELEVRSFLLVPIIINDFLWGFIGFHEAEKDRIWAKAETDALRTAADLLGALILRLRTEYKLEQRVLEIHQVFEKSPTLIWKYDPRARRYLYISKAISTISGISYVKLIENPALWMERVDKGAESQAAVDGFDQAFAQGRPFTGRYLFHTEHRGPRWMLATAVPSEENGQTYFYGATQDINDQVELEQRLRRHETHAAVGRTISGVAHYIKNIIQGIRGSTSMISRAIDKEELGKVRTLWPVLQRTTERLANLTEEMLSFTRDRQPEIQLVDIPQLVREIVDLQIINAAERNVILAYDPPEKGALPRVPCDSVMIHDAVLNVVVNCVDAAEEMGSGTVTITTDFDEASQMLRIRVHDTGPGVDEAHTHQIFEPFFTTKGNQGSGLGLAIVRKNLMLHGGSIDMKSTPGNTEFTLSLPVDACARAEAPTRVEPPG